MELFKKITGSSLINAKKCTKEQGKVQEDTSRNLNKVFRKRYGFSEGRISPIQKTQNRKEKSSSGIAPEKATKMRLCRRIFCRKNWRMKETKTAKSV